MKVIDSIYGEFENITRYKHYVGTMLFIRMMDGSNEEI